MNRIELKSKLIDVRSDIAVLLNDLNDPTATVDVSTLALLILSIRLTIWRPQRMIGMSEATPLVGVEATPLSVVRLDPKLAEFAVPAGSNKFYSEKCPTCGFEGYVNPTTPDGNILGREIGSCLETTFLLWNIESVECAKNAKNSVFDVDDEPEESYGEFYSSVDEDDYLASRQEDMDR